jgi:hypothetical protein
MQSRTFEYDGVKYKVVRPNIEQVTEGNKIRRETFNSELNSGTLIRDQLEEELRKRKLWSDDREQRYQELRKEIIDMEYTLASGGIKLNEAKKVALSMKRKRSEMVNLLSSRTDLDANTCEGRADNARFNYLFSNCLVYEDSGEKYFKNGLDDYILNLENPVAGVGANEFFYLLSDTEQVDDKLPENKFLKQFNFVNESYQLVDKDNRLIDEEGKHVDEYGNYVKWVDDTTFVFVDINGRELDNSGNFKVEFSPFLDDDGNPILSEDEKEKVEKPVAKKKVTRKRKTTPKKETVSE